MNPAPSLAQNVHQLIRVHTTRNDDGEFVKQLALIDQLADAVQNSTASRSGGSSERGLPINSDAIDLERHIKTEAMTEEDIRSGDNTGGLRVILKKWSIQDDPEWTAHLAHVTQRWVDRIGLLLAPEPPRRPLRQPCPACGEQWTTNAEGDRKPCLTARVYAPDGGTLPHDQWDIACNQCAAQWTANDDTFKYVLGALNAAA